MLIITYVLVVAACLARSAEAPRLYAVLLVCAGALIAQAIIAYAPVRWAEKDSVVGYLLSIQHLVSRMPPEEREREGKFSDIRRKYQYETPGFAPEPEGVQSG